MEWKLQDIMSRDKINQTALAEVLFNEGWTKNKPKGVTKLINEHCHDFPAFLRRRDMVRWYRMYRSYLNASPMELTGLKTDQEAIEALVKAKLQRYLDEQGVEVQLTDIVIDEVEEIEVMPAEVLEQYIGKPMRKSV